jgi:microcystin-dependent protein
MASLRWFSLNGEGNILNFNGNFNVVGDINFVGNLYRNGVLFGDGSGGPELWDGTFAGGIHYLGPVVGIGTSTPNTAYKLEVQGDVNINGDIYKNGILFTGAGGGASLWSDAGGQLSTTVNVGIGTTNPESQLHIFGTQTSFNASQGIRIGTGSDYATFNYITDPALTEHLMIQSRKSGVDFERNIALNPLGGKVGVGISEPAYKLDVFGDINFTGDLLKNGVIIGSSAGDAWKADGPDIYFDEGNVGIGGFPTVYRMAVYGDINLSISSKYRINEIEVLSETTLGSSVVNSSLTSLGNLTSLTVNTDTLVTSGPNVGIGLTNPNYKLDVFGDINITGDLFKEGSLIPLSQWSNFGSSIFYDDGNVGIGLTNPTVPLDVVGNSRLIGDVLIGGSINVDSGTLITSLGNVGVGTILLPDTLTVSGTASVSRPLRALWTEITIGSSDITSVGFNDISSVYFSSSVSGEFLTSVDGINWSGVPIAAGFIPLSVIYNQSTDKYIAVGTSPGSNPKLYTSPDGLVWTGYVSISSDLRNITFSSTDLFVACGSNTIVYSDDSLIWTTVSVTGVWNGIAWSTFLNSFVIVGEGGDISTSPDGIAWTPQTSGVLTNLLSVTSSNDLLVATGVSGILLSSTDSVTWTLETFVNTDTLFKVIWNPVDNIFIIGGQDGKLYSYPPIDEYEIFSNVTEIYAIHYNSIPSSLLVAGEGGNGNFTFGKTLFKVSANVTEVNTDFAVDTDVLFVNSTDNRVGVNTDAPTEALDVVGNAVVSGDFAVDTNVLFVNSTDNRVGVNTDAPTEALDVVGNAVVSGDFAVDTNVLFVNSTDNRVGVNTDAPTEALDVVGNAVVSGDFAVDTNVLFVNSTDNRVGVNTDAPAYSLDVVGDARVTGNFTFGNATMYYKADTTRLGINIEEPTVELDILGKAKIESNTGYTLEVVGDINFTGGLFQNDIPFVSGGGGGDGDVGDSLPIGAFVKYPWSAPIPEGYLKCDGAEVSRAEYDQLFAVLGTEYGAGDGSTTFLLPLFFDFIIKFRALGATATVDYMPIGSVLTLSWVIDPYPSGWLKCDGAEVSRTEYSQLFAAIGIDYGEGDGSTTFNLPTFFNQGIKYRTTVEAGTGDNAFWILNPNSTLYNITNVGIGTTDPTEKLTVDGNILVNGNIIPATNEAYDLGTSTSAFKDLYLSGETIFLGNTKITTDPVTGSVSFLDKDTNEVKEIVSENTQNISVQGGNTIFESGNVGIGITNPSQKLHVVGRQVLEDTGTDYMFDGHLAVDSAAWGYEMRTRRSRGTLENPSALQNNDVLFGIFNKGSRLNNDQTISAPNNVAAIRVVASGDFTQTSTPTRMDFATTDIGNTTRGTRMTINHDGNVGIGITNPVERLHIVGSALAQNGIFQTLSGYNGGWPNTERDQEWLKAVYDRGGGAPMASIGVTQFNTAGTIIASFPERLRTGITFSTRESNADWNTGLLQRMIITDIGNVGIGIADPTGKLTVNVSGESPNIAGQPSGTISLTNGATGLELPTIIGKSSSANLAGLGLLAGRLDASNSTADMTFDARTVSNTDFNSSFLTSPAFQFRRFNNPLMTILRNGNVGIGTTNPTEKLVVDDGANAQAITMAKDGFFNDQNQALLFRAKQSGTPAGSGRITGAIHKRAEDLRVISKGNISRILFYTGTNENSGFDTEVAGNPFSGNYTNTDDIPKMTIINNGNVGIGTTNPAEKLQVMGNIRLGVNANNYHHIRMGGGNSHGYLFGSFPALGDGIHLSYNHYFDSNGNIQYVNTGSGASNASLSVGYGQIIMKTGSNDIPPTTRMRIDNVGNVGIGVTNPTEKLQVAGNILASGTITPSDIRIKTDIVEIQDGQALSKLRLIEPHEYTYIDKESRGEHTVYGFLAQQVREHFPEATRLIQEYVPDVFKTCSVDLEEHIIVLGENARDGRLKIQVGNQVLELQVTKVNDMTVAYNPEDLEDGQEMQEEVFVYGYQVEDFHTLNKDYLFTINFAATQELDRTVQTQSLEITTQKQMLETQSLEIEDLKAVNDDLMIQNMSLKNRVSELESQLSSLITALTDKGIL